MTGFHSRFGSRKTTRGVEPALRRARLLAARQFGVVSPARKGILNGEWDRGTIVRQWMEGDNGR